MKSTRSPIQDALILVCKKCDKKSSEDLYDELKTQCKMQFGKGARVVLTTCLNLCPKKAIGVCVVSPRSIPEATRFFELDPDDFEREAERLIQQVNNPRRT